jgi:hypothetical protein
MEDLPQLGPSLRPACTSPTTYCVSALALRAGFQALPCGTIESVFSVPDDYNSDNIREPILGINLMDSLPVYAIYRA